MSYTVEIPGGTATLLDADDELSVRREHLIEKYGMAAASLVAKLPADADPAKPETLTGFNITPDEAQLIINMYDAILIALLESWTLDRPLPTMDTIGDLPASIYRPLMTAVRGNPGAAGGVNFDATPDKDSPTGPSSNSSGSLRGETSKSTRKSPRGGRSTSTGASTPA